MSKITSLLCAAALAGAVTLGLTGCVPHPPAGQHAAAQHSSSEHAPDSAVPDVVGHTVSEADDALSAAGLTMDAGSAGPDDIVLSADPAPGVAVDTGTTVTLTTAPATVDVPDVVGDTIADAKAALQDAGLVLSAGSAGSTYTVATENPKAGTSVKKGTTVTVTATPPLTLSQQNALAKAKDYLQTMAFSRSGLIQQLEFEGYSAADSTFAVDHTGANWNTEAVAKAKEYLQTMPFSHSGLVGQLEFEGFTAAQAEYGVKGAGL